MSALGLTIVAVGLGLGLLALLTVLFAGNRASAHSREGSSTAGDGNASNIAPWGGDGGGDGGADCADGGGSSCD